MELGRQEVPGWDCGNGLEEQSEAGTDGIFSLFSTAGQKMAMTADGQWNQKDKLCLSSAFEINRKSILQLCTNVQNWFWDNPSQMIFFFFFIYTHDLCRDFSEGLGFADSQPLPYELVGLQSPCLAGAPKPVVAWHAQWRWPENSPAWMSLKTSTIALYLGNQAAPSAFYSWPMRRNKTDLFAANWDQMHVSV